MESIRKWFYKPKKGDRSLLAQFFYADDELNAVAAELDSFDGKKDPQRCTALVNHLRQCQDKVLTICIKIMDELIPGERASRDFRVKFPDDVIQDNLAGQLWFGAECLSAGSSIMNRESESGAMRPLARALTKSLEKVRGLLRDASLCSDQTPPCLRNLISCLCTFDHLLAEFELRYVSAMVPVKTAHEYELQQLVVVLFSETLQRALVRGLLTQDMVDDYDPALMFTIPRLAIVSGLLYYPYMSPLSLNQSATNMSDMFRPFRSLLLKIRELMLTLNEKELFALERMLCSSDEVKFDEKLPTTKNQQQLSSQETSEDEDEDDDDGDEEDDDDDDDDDGDEDDCDDGDDNDDDSECLSSSTAELVMENNNVVAATIEHCGSKGGGFSVPPPPPPPPPQDLINNNDGVGIPSMKNRPFVSPTTACRKDLCNEQLLKSSAPAATINNGGGECGLLESSTGSVPDAVLTESLATATEALTEILVKPATAADSAGRQDANGNDETTATAVPQPVDVVKRHHPNVSSSSTQTERSPPSSSYRVCCCKEWNCWKSVDAVDDDKSGGGGGGRARCDSLQFGQPSPTRPCCHHHHRRKKASGGVTTSPPPPVLSRDKTTSAAVGCECGAAVVSSKYSKSWRELRKCSSAPPATHDKRSSGGGPTMICRFQSCNNNNNNNRSSSKPPLIKKHEMCSSCSSCTTSSADESDESVTDSTSTNSSCNYSLRQQKARAKFRSNEDLIHRLFVCVSGVADQLQTNFAGDLRNILKAVFLMSNSNCNIDSQPNTEVMPMVNNTTAVMIENGEEALIWRGENIIGDMLSTTTETPPPWVPDNEAPVCMSCKAMFTVVRRRHHCRNCGKVFCSRCSSNSVPLPRFGHLKPVRVCNRCFIYQVTPFSLEPSIGPVPIVMQS